MNTNEDNQRDIELDRCLERMSVSDCCGEPAEFESDNICTKCLEICEFINIEEYKYELKLAADCDAADAKRELEREDD